MKATFHAAATLTRAGRASLLAPSLYCGFSARAGTYRCRLGWLREDGKGLFGIRLAQVLPSFPTDEPHPSTHPLWTNLMQEFADTEPGLKTVLPTGMSKPGTPHPERRPSAADKNNNREECSVAASQERPQTPVPAPRSKRSRRGESQPETQRVSTLVKDLRAPRHGNWKETRTGKGGAFSDIESRAAMGSIRLLGFLSSLFSRDLLIRSSSSLFETLPLD